MIQERRYRIKNLFSILAILTLILEFLFAIGRIFVKEYAIDFPIFYILLLLPLGLKFLWFVVVTRDSESRGKIFGFVFLICMLVYGLGLVAKLEHYSWAAVALTLGGFGALVVYSIRFVLKKKKSNLDWVKYLFLLTFIILSMMVLEHYINSLFGLIHVLLFYTLIFMFAYEKDKKRGNKKEAFSFEEKE